MYESILIWAALGLIFLLCLPLTGLQRGLLAIYSWILRLGMLAIVIGAAYLWFQPQQLPSEVAETVRNSYLLRTILPDPAAARFGIYVAALAAVIILPLIAVFDISRHFGRRERVVVTETVRVAAPAAVNVAPVENAEPQYPVRSRFGRRAAANAMANVRTVR